MLTGCTKGEDGDSGMSNVNAPSDMPYNGAFEINWTVDGQTVGTSTLEMMYTANILSLPHNWLHQQLFPGQTVTLLSDDIAQIWALHLSPTGYSDDNNYFAIDVLLLILVKCSTFSLGFIRNTKKFPLGFVVLVLVFLSVLSNKQQFFVLVLSEKTISGAIASATSC